MVANFNDRNEVEHFLRDANADELNAERAYLQNLMLGTTLKSLQQIVLTLDARITYELRFRVSSILLQAPPNISVPRTGAQRLGMRLANKRGKRHAKRAAMCAGQQITAPEPEIIAELVEEEVIAGPAAAGSVVISHQLERLICVAEVVGQ